MARPWISVLFYPPYIYGLHKSYFRGIRVYIIKQIIIWCNVGVELSSTCIYIGQRRLNDYTDSQYSSKFQQSRVRWVTAEVSFLDTLNFFWRRGRPPPPRCVSLPSENVCTEILRGFSQFIHKKPVYRLKQDYISASFRILTNSLFRTVIPFKATNTSRCNWENTRCVKCTFKIDKCLDSSDLTIKGKPRRITWCLRFWWRWSSYCGLQG
jgi:hypothetical protein